MDNARVPDWLPEAIAPGWTFLATYPIVLSLAIAVVGLGLAFIGRALILAVGLRMAGHLPGDLAARLVRIAAIVAALVIASLALVLSVQVLGLPARGEQIAVRIVISLLLLQLMRQAMRASHVGLEILGRLRDRYAIVEERTMPLFDLMLTVIIVAFTAYVLLQVWNIDATAWLASAGIIGIAVGFAARDTLANLFAGFFIIADAPYKVGDYIVFDTGERGEVTKVGIRSTRILTRDDVEVIMPNSAMANSKVVNESGGRWERYRIRIQVGVAYGSDVDEVVELLEKVASEHETVCKEPDPRVRMRGFGDSSLDFELLCWINQPSLRGLIAHELYMKIYKELARADIVIPFPQRDVWMRDSGAGSAKADSTADERR